jgi:peptidyl-prolyl cis-trans isomerase SurA
MTIKKACMVLWLVLACSTACFGATYEDGIAVVVNNDVITISEINQEVEGILKRIGNPPEAEKETLLPEVRKTAMNKLIDDLLIGQEAAKMSIIIPAENVDATIQGMLQERKIPMEAFLATLAKDGGTMDEYRQEVKQYLTRMKLISREIRPKISVNEEEIGAYYSEHRDLYEGKEAVRLGQILFVLPEGASAANRKEIMAQAGAVLARLQNGESFELLASQFNTDPAARASGGDLGFVERGMLRDALNEVAFSLPPGQTSGVIETPVGFHIIRVTEKRGAGIKPIGEVRAEVEEKIAAKKTEAKYLEWIDALRQKAHIEIRIGTPAAQG